MGVLSKVITKNWILYCLIAVFLLPILAAFILKYYLATHPLDFTLKNKGKFAQQQLILPTREFSKLDYPHWSVILFLPKVSSNKFEQHISEIEELHLSLTKDIKRVELLSIGSDAGANYVHIPLSDELQYMLSESVLNLSPGEVMFVDPRGELILTFAASINKKIVMSELKHLLKISQHG